MNTKKNLLNQIKLPNNDEIRVLKFLATKFPTDIHNLQQLYTKIKEMEQSSRSQVFDKALKDLASRFTIFELQKMIISITKETEEYNQMKPVGRIRTPILFQQNLKQSTTGILTAFHNLQMNKNKLKSNKNYFDSINTKPSPEQPKRSDLNAGEFSLIK